MLTLEQKALLEQFKRYIVVKGYAKGYEKNAAAAIKECLLFMNEKGIASLEYITTQNLSAYHHYLKHRPNKTRYGTLSAGSVSGHFFALKLYFGYAQKMELIDINPMGTLNYPKGVHKTREVLTLEQMKTLYEACKNEQERAILALFYGCGLRRMEGEKLNVRDVDFKNAFLYVRSGKGNKRRVVPMPKNVIKDLHDYYYHFRPQQISKDTNVDDRRAFMLNKNGTRMRANSYWSYFKRILKRAAIEKDISLHHLRHSIATHLLAGGMKIEAVRDFLGHTCLETTQIYTRVTKEQLK